MKISEGVTEDGIIVGNTFDKYHSRNPLVQKIMRGFHAALNKLIATARPENIHEVGCGEGYWVMQWNKEGLDARGSDFSSAVVGLANDNAADQGLRNGLFAVQSIYQLDQAQDAADLIVCCEVLEHLDNPRLALQNLQSVTERFAILSVPREPLWSVLNMVRGRYWSDFGNTPGHVQRWSRQSFIDLVSEYFIVEEVLSPIPWTMILCSKRNDGE